MYSMSTCSVLCGVMAVSGAMVVSLGGISSWCSTHVFHTTTTSKRYTMRLFLAITSLIALPFLSLHTSFSQEITATDGSISFVCKSSQVLSFGTNRNGRFGNGLESTEYGSGAAQVSQKLTKLVSNGSGIGAVTEAGDVIVWGDLDWQQIGIRGFETPVLTPLTLPYIDNVDHLAFGLGHTVFLRNDSTVSVCGSNRHSQHAMPSDFVLDSGHTTVPISQVMKVAAGTASVFALKSDGELFGWELTGATVCLWQAVP